MCIERKLQDSYASLIQRLAVRKLSFSGVRASASLEHERNRVAGFEATIK